MVANTFFEEGLNKNSKNRKGLSKAILKGLSAAFLVVSATGCSFVANQVSMATDALNADFQTTRDGNTRIQKFRTALLSGDLPGAIKIRDNIFSDHWRCIADIEIASFRYKVDREASLSAVKDITEEVWAIKNPNRRAMALFSLLKFHLEKEQNITKSKEVLEQLKKTIEFIPNEEFYKKMRLSELRKLIQKNNHLLSR